MELEIKEIAKIHTDFPEKFGIPRQSGLVPELRGKIVFSPEYRVPEAFRGLEGYSHLWVVWSFSEAKRESWSPTVRPPRLGGQKRMGVFATRSPFRPNPIALSCVKLEGIEADPRLGTVLKVSGVDMLDGTPVYDIKPYLPHADCHPEATGGFSAEVKDHRLEVVIPPEHLEMIPSGEREAVKSLLAQDPRTAFIHDDERVWGLSYAGLNIRFTVQGDILTVCGVEREKEN